MMAERSLARRLSCQGPWRAALCAATAVLLTGCARWPWPPALQGQEPGSPGSGNQAATHSTIPAIAGLVDFGGPGARNYRTQSTMSDVGLAATVSLIDPTSNQVVSTALTDTTGSFVMGVSTLPVAGRAYYIEAVKGLQNNAVGSDAARVRTVIAFNGGAWATMTQGQITINVSTTALSIIASFNQTSVTPANLLATILLNQASNGLPDTFLSTNTGVSQSAFEQVYSLVKQSLTDDADPFDAITYNGSSYLPKADVSLEVDRITPGTAAIGTTVTIWGAGLGLGNSVTFAPGVVGTVVSGSSNQLQVKVPDGAQTGTVTVKGGKREASTPFTVIPLIGGEFKP